MAKNKQKSPGLRSRSTEIVQPDQNKLITFYENHKDLLSYAGTGIVIIVIIISLVIMNNKSKNRQASVLFQRGMTSYTNTFSGAPADPDAKSDTFDATDTINAFQEVVDNFPNTPTGINSLYMIGMTQLNSGQDQKAIDTFNQFIANHSDHLMVANAMLGLATAQFNLGDSQTSLSTLEKITADYPAFPLMDAVKFETAKRYEAKNDWEKARELYQLVLDTYPDSGWKFMAQRRIGEIDKAHPADDGNINAES